MADTKISEMSGTKVFIGIVLVIVVSLTIFTVAKNQWEKRSLTA